MYSLLAFLVYLAAVVIPVYLLYRFHSQAWYWHVLAILAAMAVGLVPTPPEWKSRGFDLLFGFVLVWLMVWGIGGFLTARGHRERHA